MTRTATDPSHPATVTWSAHLSMLFTERPVLERPRAAREAGFSTVETWWPGELARSWANRIKAEGLEVALLNADCGDIHAGERGFLNIPSRRDEELRKIDDAVRLAGQVASPRVNVLAGRSLTAFPKRKQLAEVRRALTVAAERASAADIVLVLEPINRIDIPDYLVPDATAARRLIEAVGSPSVRLLYDAYHAAQSGIDPIREAPTLIDIIDHVQYADWPGRGAPGTGEVDLHRFVDALLEAGYRGAIGLEYDPRGNTLSSLAFLE
jgi:hydroxypyruvate isomerase